jgi:hypothetical protein
VRTAGAGDQAGFTQADDELLEIGPRQRLVLRHLRQADGAAAVVARQLDHEARSVFAARREMDRARAGKDAPRAARRITHLAVIRRGQRLTAHRRIPSYHVRIESSPALAVPQSARAALRRFPTQPTAKPRQLVLAMLMTLPIGLASTTIHA